MADAIMQSGFQIRCTVRALDCSLGDALLAVWALPGGRLRRCGRLSHSINAPDEQEDHEGDDDEIDHCIDEGPIMMVSAPDACAVASVS